MAEEQLRLERDERPSRIERKTYVPEQGGTVQPKTHNRPSLINFLCMLMVSGFFDILSLFLSEIPFVGAGIVLVSNTIFIPWFYMSGMKFTNKRITAFGIQTIAESIPFVGNFPFITPNIIYSYYSN